VSHLITFPFLLPLLAGALLMACADRPTARKVITVVMGLVGLAVGVALVMRSVEGPVTYQLGDWPAPFGISMHLDRLSATMVMLSAVIAAVAVLPAVGVDDARSRYALALAQFQVAGINGAFLAGDLFNLFVCFEILLISSYALMVQGNGRAPRAALVYTVINLTGSAIFLIGIGLLYGATGTLNLADLAVRLQMMPPEVAALGVTGAWLVALVFALKAAMLPVGLWLPGAYAIAGPTAVTLFALLTKVGVYSLLRVFGPWFGGESALDGIGTALWVGALVSLIFGAMLALAATTLRRLAGALVVGSVATALLALSIGGTLALSAALFYTLHSTVAAAACFLVAAALARLRGEAEDRLDVAPAITGRGNMMLLFLGIAIVVSGLPPLSGFLGKVSVLQAVMPTPQASWSVTVLLVSSLLTLLAVARAGNAVFLKAPSAPASEPGMPGGTVTAVAAGVMLVLSIAMSVFGGPLRQWTDMAAFEVSQLAGPAFAPLPDAIPAHGAHPEIP
jgi:multicomponent K+:H+ antiporter subunit D